MSCGVPHPSSLIRHPSSLVNKSMPPRLFVLAIVLFWLATSVWLFQRDIWPQLRRDAPPPFVIDLADEARQHPSTIRWAIKRNGHEIGYAETGMKYRDRDDTFELRSHVPTLDVQGIKGTNLNSVYRVTREGALREIIIDGEFKIALGLLKPTVYLRIEGRVAGDWFEPHGYIVFGDDPKNREVEENRRYFELERVPVAARGNVVNPLHPVNRIPKLRPGQHWKQPLVDPLADSVNAMIQKEPALQAIFKRTAEAPMLQAEVVGGAHSLPYGNLYYGCILIEYRGENIFARTWVRESDGLVLKQEATVWGDQIVLERL
jgi:hypothetical protein